MSDFVRSIKIETALTPPITVSAPFASSSGQPPSGVAGFFLRLLKPKITIDTALGTKVYAPEGEPGPSAWPYIVVAAAIIVGWLIWR